jgi:hypothetical protein
VKVSRWRQCNVTHACSEYPTTWFNITREEVRTLWIV